jgi:hypothetical protein
MKFLSWMKPKVKPTGKVIDMTRMGWGHNMSFSKHPEHGAYDWRSAIWYGNGVSVGDEIIWSAGDKKDHEVKSIITKVEHTGNVWDMYFIEGEVTHINGQPLEG